MPAPLRHLLPASLPCSPACGFAQVCLGGGWHAHPPVQPRAVAAKRGIASVSYKIFIIIILIIIDSTMWGWGTAQESLWAGSCL